VKKISVLQNNVVLFAQLYIAMLNRESDLKEFFSHEIQSFPPSLSEFGNLRLPTAKSNLLKCLPTYDEQARPPSHFDCKILDGAVIVHFKPLVLLHLMIMPRISLYHISNTIYSNPKE
jgi:hypothetical protein